MSYAEILENTINLLKLKYDLLMILNETIVINNKTKEVISQLKKNLN